MPATWLIADTHFGHYGVCKFLRKDGTKLRPWDNPQDMDEHMVKVWNETVRPKDKVYHLGDVVINRKALGTLARLNGEKILIKGNHDIFRLEEYTPYFRDIRGYHVLSGIILSHIPVHEESLGRFGCNVHGHLHANRVMRNDCVDERYYCVSVEHTNFRPILLEEVIKKIKEQGGEIGLKNKSEDACET